MKKGLLCYINALPTDWVPNTKTSHTLERVIEEKKLLHEECQQQLEDKLAFIKGSSEDEIKTASNGVKDSILNLKKDVEELIRQHEFDFNKGIVAVEESLSDIFCDLGSQVICLCQPVKEEIQKLEEELRNIETDRMNKFKEVLKQTADKMNKIFYKLPEEIEDFIEKELTQINQITLSNYYTYSKLIAQLINVVISCENRWLNTISEMSRNYDREYQEQLERTPKATEMESIADEQDMGGILEFAETISNEFVQVCSESIVAIDLMNTFLNQINEGKFDASQQLSVDLAEASIPKRTFTEIYDEIVASLIKNENDEEEGISYQIDTIKMMEKWQEYVILLQDDVQFCKDSTFNASHLFETHFARCSDANRVFSMDLYYVIDSSITSEDGLLIDLHKAIDEVRTSPTEEKLLVAMGACKKIIDNMQKIIQQDIEKQMKIFDKLRDLIANELELLILEINYHLKQQPKGHDVDATIFRGRKSKAEKQSLEHKPYLMKEFDADIKALHNWLFGMNFHLREAANTCAQKYQEKTENLISQQTIILLRNLEMKKTLIEENYQQIFHHVYRVRLAEIKFHEQRLHQHILAINNEIELIKPSEEEEEINEEKEIQSNYTKYLKDFNQKNKTIEKTLKDGVVPFKIVRDNLKSYKTTCEETINKKKEELVEKASSKVNKLLNLNISFIQSVKLFSEDGNYSIEEISTMQEEIVNVNKTLTEVKTILLKGIETEYNAVINEVTQIENEITKNIEESTIHLEFQHFVKTHSFKVTEAIRSETLELIERSNQLTAYIDRLQSLAIQNTGNVEYLDDFCENCEYMRAIFEDLYQRLLQTETYNLNEMLFVASSESLNVINKITKKFDQKQANNGKGSKSNFSIVFPYIPQGDNYMARIIKLLLEAFETLQTQAKEYFQNSRKDNSEEEQEKYKNSFKALIIETLAKYLFFQMQCDETLLEMVMNYILELDNFLSFISTYYKQSIEVYIKTQLDMLSKNCSMIRKEFYLHKRSLEEAYEEVRNKLKPLHGHPNNKQLLNELTNEIEEIGKLGETYQVDLDELYTQSKILIEENTGIFEEQLSTMSTRLKECIQQFFVLYLEDAQIFNQLKAKFEYFDKIVNDGKFTMIKLSEESLNTEIIDVINSKINTLKQYLKISSSNIAEDFHKKLDNASTIREKYSSYDNNLSDNESFINIDNIIAEFTNSQQNCLQEIKDEKNVLGICKLWAEVWQNDVAKICALYEVKYAIPQSNIEMNTM